ncbi:MAG: TetR/AcrR family transcriptional regulator [Bacteroidales bacterium]|nr:TetR/AcrR family transcriptional regulator [Bacteroidales bacterium]
MIKERIIAVSAELFMQYGVRTTTMDDIARHMGISKRTIYENFKNKEDILTACISSFYEEGKREIDHVLETTDNVVEAVVIMLRKGTEQARKQRYFIMEDIRKYAPEVYQHHLMNKHAEQQKRMEDMVRQGIREGVFRSDLNPEIIAIVFAQQSEGLTLNNRNFDRFSVFELFENMILLYLRGLCTPKGLEILNGTLSKNSVNL